jgi:hypothetical protein
MMKKENLLLFLSLFTTVSFAQLPKGDRTLAWQIDLAENNNYDSAFSYAQKACMQSVHLFYTWSSIEPSTGNFDAAFIGNTLDAANIYYPIFGMKVELQLAPINTGAKETPQDLKPKDFDDPVMIQRFKIFLDTVFSRIPNVELSALNIGNESNAYLGTNTRAYTAFKTFLDSVVPYAKQKYRTLHGQELKVGTTLTFEGLTEPATKTLCRDLNKDLDIVALTYYPLASDFSMKAPEVVYDDFDELVQVYTDTSQPIYFVECGYSSSDSCKSSESQQAEFYRLMFSAWDSHADLIKYMTIFKSTDWSQAQVEELGRYYGVNDTRFLEYLRTLGVRTWDGNGQNKMAYETILCELNARGWCSVSCTTRSIEKEEELQVQVYPNPVSDYLYIESRNTVQTIEAYNAQGVLVGKSSEQTISFNKVPDGIYCVRIQFKSGQTAIKKVIKTK